MQKPNESRREEIISKSAGREKMEYNAYVKKKTKWVFVSIFVNLWQGWHALPRKKEAKGKEHCDKRLWLEVKQWSEGEYCE